MKDLSQMIANNRRLMDLRGKFTGRRCFIIGNGPSLRAADLDRLHAAGELTMASNKIYLIFPQTAWRPTYYLIGDKVFAASSTREIGENFLGNVLYADYLDQEVPAPARFASFQVLPRYVRNAPVFSEDLVKGIGRGCTITYTAMQVAWWLGISEVYLLGVDFNYVTPNLRPSVQHPGYNTYTTGEVQNYFIKGYVKPDEPVVAPDMEASLQAYRAAQLKASASEHFKIYNAGRGGKLEVFPRVDFDAVLNTPAPALGEAVARAV